MHLLELICSHSGGYGFPPAAAAMNHTALMGVLMKIRSGIGPSETVVKRKKNPPRSQILLFCPPLHPKIKATKVSTTQEPPPGRTQQDKEVVAWSCPEMHCQIQASVDPGKGLQTCPVCPVILLQPLFYVPWPLTAYPRTISWCSTQERGRKEKRERGRGRRPSLEHGGHLWWYPGMQAGTARQVLRCKSATLGSLCECSSHQLPEGLEGINPCALISVALSASSALAT